MAPLPKPQYSIWQAINASIALGMRAIEEVRALAKLPGPQGDSGEPGRDGLGFDDLAFSYDGERTIIANFKRGTSVKEVKMIVPFPIYRGVFKSDQQYARGDVVTFGGSAWVAQRDTSDKPESGDAWQLAIKRGRDGKDGKDGDKGERGLEGPPGQDVRR